MTLKRRLTDLEKRAIARRAQQRPTLPADQHQRSMIALCEALQIAPDDPLYAALVGTDKLEK